MTTSIWKKSVPNPVKAHLVDEIRFTHGENSDLAPLSCTCGWEGINADFTAHRGIPKREQSGPRSMKCAADDCERRAHTKGWCHGHYSRWRRGVALDKPLGVTRGRRVAA